MIASSFFFKTWIVRVVRKGVQANPRSVGLDEFEADSVSHPLRLSLGSS
jgi:hypothetical protein